MTLLLPVLLGWALLAAPPEEAAVQRFLRPGGKAVEVELTETATAAGGRRVVRRSGPDRGGESLTLEYDRAGRLVSAELLRQVEGTRRRALLTVQGKGGLLRRDGVTDFLMTLPANPVLVTGPGAGEVFQVLRQYDRRGGDKQVLAAVLLDPLQPYQALKVTAERLRSEVVKHEGEEVKVDRYRLDLPGGPCAAWADGDGRVIKVQLLAPGAPPLVLEGFEEAARGLAP